MEVIPVTTATGETVLVKPDDLFKALLQDKSFRLCGMDTRTILELRHQYLRRDGPEPITPETVKEAFKENYQ